MNLTTLVILVVLLLLIVAVLGVLLFLRRRRQAPEAKAARPKTTAKPQKPKPAKKAPPEETEQASPPPPAAAEAPAKSAPPAAKAPAQAAPPKPAPAPSPPPAPPDLTQTGEKIRILVVDDNRDTQDHVSRLLYFEKDMEVIGQALNGRMGVEMAMELKPHIVLMDINMPDMDGIEATEQMSVKAPFSQVIVMSVQAEQHYMRRAMAAGAREFQPKPFTSDELNSCIRRVYQRALPTYQQLENAARVEAVQAEETKAKSRAELEEGGLVIVVYGPKGGTGVSTVAVNLAVALQQVHGDVVLMDGDLQFGDVLVHLNTKPTRTMTDLIFEGAFDIELLPDVILPHASGLKLLLAPPQPELADAITPAMVDQVIQGLKSLYKIVVIDTDSGLTDKTLTILDSARHMLLVSAPELPAVKNVKLFMEIAQQLEFGSDRLTMVLNRAGLIGGVPVEKIEKALNIHFAYHIPDDPRMHLATTRGMAVTQQDAAAPAAQAITHIARDILQKLIEDSAAPVKEMA